MSPAYAETCIKRLASPGLSRWFKTSPRVSVQLRFPLKDQPLLNWLLRSLGWSFQTGFIRLKLKQIKQKLHKPTVLQE